MNVSNEECTNIEEWTKKLELSILKVGWKLESLTLSVRLRVEDPYEFSGTLTVVLDRKGKRPKDARPDWNNLLTECGIRLKPSTDRLEDETVKASSPLKNSRTFVTAGGWVNRVRSEGDKRWRCANKLAASNLTSGFRRQSWRSHLVTLSTSG